MAQYDSFILRIWQSSQTNGKQWAGKLQHLPDGENLRFTDPDALLAYLSTVLIANGVPSHASQPRDNVIRFSREGGATAGERCADDPET